jgi:hypothetical protein
MGPFAECRWYLAGGKSRCFRVATEDEKGRRQRKQMTDNKPEDDGLQAMMGDEAADDGDSYHDSGEC